MIGRHVASTAERVESLLSRAEGATMRITKPRGKMAAETRYCINSDGVALASASWQIKGTGPDGKSLEVHGMSADVLRRQDEGH